MNWGSPFKNNFQGGASNRFNQQQSPSGYNNNQWDNSFGGTERNNYPFM